MINLTAYHPQFRSLLPETHELLMASNLTIHPSVAKVALHGSRGLAKQSRPDSDIDLSLLLDHPSEAGQPDTELLQEVWNTTINHWQSSVDLDLAVIFETRQCHFKCFEQTHWNEQTCTIGGVDCFGLYKLQKGFNGLVIDAGVQVKLMYPCLVIWQKN